MVGIRVHTGNRLSFALSDAIYADPFCMCSYLGSLQVCMFNVVATGMRPPPARSRQWSLAVRAENTGSYKELRVIMHRFKDYSADGAGNTARLF